MIKRAIKKNYILLAVLLAGVFAFFDFALAQSCPGLTTVEGTTVTFVGELTDAGGDNVNYVWFEYGQTTSFGQKTTEKALNQAGMYCIVVSGLNPSTTYYYRAAARNSAGTSYGEIKSFTTTTPREIADFSVQKTVRNLSDGTSFVKSVAADPGEVLIFRIAVKAGDNSLTNITVKDTLPIGTTYIGDLRIDNVAVAGNILTGLNIGSLAAQQEKAITFRVDVADQASFAFGQTELTNTVLVSSDAVSRSDTAKVFISKTAVAGAATAVVTGLTDNIFFDSFLLPSLITLLIVWLFKSRIIKFEEWLDSRKREYQIYKSKKILKIKIAKAKVKEFLQRG